MILPTKHTNFSQSLLGFSAYLLELLKKPLSMDDLWFKYEADYKSGKYYAKHSLNNLVLSLLFLYSINAIREENGIISRCN